MKKPVQTRHQWNRFAVAAASSAVIAFSGGLLAAGCAPRSGCKPRASAGACGPATADKGQCGPMIPAEKVTRPEGVEPYQGDSQAGLVAMGERLFKETQLSSNGLSCNSCHANQAGYADTFAEPYPHYVKMADDQGGIKEIHLDEMVQFCLLSPMAGEALPWDSKELAALTAYTRTQQEAFEPGQNAGAAGACAPKGGCAPKGACAPKGGCAPKASPCAPQ